MALPGPGSPSRAAPSPSRAAPSPSPSAPDDGPSPGTDPSPRPTSATPSRRSRPRLTPKRRLALDGAACLVTGASGGIGAATARRLARRGARVALHGRDRAVLERLAAETGGVAVVADLTRPGAAEAAAAEAEERLGPLDVVVSNAGAGWAGDFVAMDPACAEELFALNLLAPVRLARAVLPGMAQRGHGHLVLVGSIAGHLGVRQEAVYSATKSGLAALASSLRDEMAPAGVGVSLISPGVVATPFFERRGSPYVRSRPRPIPADRVAAAVERAVTHDRSRLIVPAWMELPVALSAVAPRLYRRLSVRFG